MLRCRACNTRFENGRTACPSCGRRAFESVSNGPVAEAPRALSPSSVTQSMDDLDEEPDDMHEPTAGPGDETTDVDLDLGGLDEVDVLAEAIQPEAAQELEKPEPTVASRPPGGLVEPGPAVFHLSAAQVRTLVVEQPELLAPDLEIHRDDNQVLVGVDFRTPVGAIDLLARDRRGDFVVVAVPDPRDVDTLMPETLARLGWVRKHLAGRSHGVRGIVVVEEIPEELAYAAAGLAETISFKTFRVALTFHDLQL